MVRDIRAQTQSHEYVVYEGCFRDGFKDYDKIPLISLLRFVRIVRRFDLWCDGGDWSEEEVVRLIESLKKADKV